MAPPVPFWKSSAICSPKMKFCVNCFGVLEEAQMADILAAPTRPAERQTEMPKAPADQTSPAQAARLRAADELDVLIRARYPIIYVDLGRRAR
jgi:hypothetical protein